MSNWETENPTLASGEQGHETDTGKRKIGDGSTAWNSLDYMYGTAATADTTTSSTDTTSGRVLKNGDWGVGGGPGVGENRPTVDSADELVNTQFTYQSGIDNLPDGQTSHIMVLSNQGTSGDFVAQLGVRAAGGRGYFRVNAAGTWTSWVELYHTGNVTVDGDGFLKEASPIIRLYTDSIEEDSHNGATLEHTATGVYRISGTEGFAQSGWYIENYKDANGNIKVFVEYEYTDGVIEVRTFEPTGTGWRAEKGAPMDIHEGRYITIRLHKTEEDVDGER